MSGFAITRRGFVAGAGALVAAPFVPRIAHSAPGRDPRLLTVVMRGALDSLAVVAPVGDPDYRRMREELAFEDSGPTAGIPLDNFFVLNPNMPQLADLYKNGEALIVHAVATPYRSRSHFDGQDVLESGFPMPGRMNSGWLNRALGEIARGESIDKRGFAVGAQVPLIMRGETDVLSWMPPGFKAASTDTRMRLLDMYRHADPTLASAIEEGVELDDLTGGERSIVKVMQESRQMGGSQIEKNYRTTGTIAGRVLGDVRGPRLGAFDLLGWDTHATERPVVGKLGRQLQAVDAMIAALKAQLAPVWQDTVVMFVTEFGRTVRVHGTATMALLVGGAVRGGRVIADWPGLSEAAQYEGRDLKPTTDLRAVLKGVLRDHLDLSDRALAETVFPESGDVRPLEGLIA